jgi:hypothetical protein
VAFPDGGFYCDGIGYFAAPDPNDGTRFAADEKACQDTYFAAYTQCTKLGDPYAANCQAVAYLSFESCFQAALTDGGWHP